MKEQDTTRDLTICAVYHSPETHALLEANIALTARMNPDSAICWLVADNSPDAPWETRVKGLATFIKGAPVPIGIPSWAKGSYHHAAGLNLLLPHIRTRYVLFLDVDFFLVGMGWYEGIISHMQEKNLAIFGAPYHPRDHRKYRYFPCAYCMFIDGSKINVKDLDFSPLVEMISSGRIRHFFAHDLPEKILKKRYSIHGTKDTGYKIYEKFSRDSTINAEYVIPVWNPRRNPIEYILPERLCLVPKRASSMSAHGFAECGHTNLTALDGEEFMRNDVPFGFHIKSGTNKMKESTEERMAFLWRVFEEFTP